MLSDAPQISAKASGAGAHERDVSQIQSRIAYRLIWIFAGTISLTFLVFSASKAWGLDPRDVRELGQTMLSVEATLLASAVGFYYGEALRR